MPDPTNFSTRAEWMAACVPVAIDEGVAQDQAVAMCSSMWSEKSEQIFKGALFKTRKDIIKVAE